ncbi:helix-turn-helix domain-containing protein [Pseudomonadota bacterium]
MDRHPHLVLLGAQIRELRKTAGYSQESFANSIGMARAYFGGVERGERNIAALNLIKIANALGLEVGELFPPIQDLQQNQG